MHKALEVILGLIVMSALIDAQADSSYQSPSSSGSTSSSAYEAYQRSSSPGAILTKQCADEAGIPANDPQHRITPEEMRRLTSCIDRNMGGVRSR